MYKNTGLKEELVSAIIEYAKKYDVEKLLLFGSRARGDFHEKSDIDLAFWGGDGPGFSLDLDEEAPTLLFFDVVNMLKPVSRELKESIDQDGIILYQKHEEI